MLNMWTQLSSTLRLKRKSVSMETLLDRREKLITKRTKAESDMISLLIWLGVSFKFQEIVAPYIVDFLLPEQKIILELDGSVHKDRDAKDDNRSRYLLFKGYNVYRIYNYEVNEDKVREIINQ
jgi:very-short-patch-repair endonuclease